MSEKAGHDSSAATRAEPSASRRGTRRDLRSAVQWGLIVFAPFVVAIVAARVGTLALVVLVAGASAAAALHVPAIPLVASVFLASFVNYGSGNLLRDLSVVLGLISLGALGYILRARVTHWKRPASALTFWLLVWTAQLAVGFLIGLVSGHAVRFILLEAAAYVWPLLACLFAQTLDTRRLRLWLALVLVLGLAHVVFGIVNLLMYQQRLGGVYFTAIPGYVAVGAMNLYFLSESRWVRRVALFAFPLLLAHVFLSFSRGYWMGFLVGTGVTFFYVFLGERGRADQAGRRIARGLIGLSCAVLLAALSVALLFGSTGIFEGALNRLTSSFSTRFTGETASNVFRLIEYDTAIREALVSPVFGRGMGATVEVVDPLLKTRTTAWYIHNYFLFIFLKFGAVGLFIFLILMWQLARRAVYLASEGKSGTVRSMGCAGVATIAQVLVISLTHYPLADVNSAYTFAFLWGILLMADFEVRQKAG